MAYKFAKDQNAWRQAHTEISSRWRINHAEQNRKIQRENTAQRRYGLTRDEQVKLYSMPCEICGQHQKKMCIDHVIPGTYRGVLCQQCNTRLGWFEKFKEIIVSYIQRGPHARSIKGSTCGDGYSRA